MRIRRRPQPSLLQASDPATSAPPSHIPQNAARSRGCLEGDGEEGRLHASPSDLGRQKSGVARRLALPQDNAVDSGASVGAGQGDGDVVHMRCSTVENGHHGWDQKDSMTWTTGAVGIKPEPATAANVEGHDASNGVMLPMAPAVVVKDEAKVSNGSCIGVGGSTKKRRGPAVLLEGSRCSRVNGRGWRCSQPTLVGYSLCEHHLGKGRARSGGGGGARGGPGQLGRTEHRARVPTSAAAVEAGTFAALGEVTVTAAPDSDELPGLPRC